MNVISFVFTNGEFDETLSDLSQLPKTVMFQNEKNHYRLQLTKNTHLSLPIHFKYLNGCESGSFTLLLEENSNMIFIEEYTSDHQSSYLTNSRLDLQLNKNAKLHYYKIQNENQEASHQVLINVAQRKASEIKMFFADCGSNKSRSDVHVKQHESHASCAMNGLYFLNHHDQHINNVIYVEHIAEFGESSMNFKGVLDKKSKAQFLGMVHIHEHAKRTHAQQENHNLLLSPLSEVTSQPKLEIYADDVKCTHGATVGQLAKDSIFYLRSRGIEERVALKMLTDAFVEEIIEKIDDSAIKHYIQQKVAIHEAF